MICRFQSASVVHSFLLELDDFAVELLDLVEPNRVELAFELCLLQFVVLLPGLPVEHAVEGSGKDHDYEDERGDRAQKDVCVIASVLVGDVVSERQVGHSDCADEQEVFVAGEKDARQTVGEQDSHDYPIDQGD